mgnify:CR=1 FL=1
MLKELINRARGQVWLRVTCPYPERVLNLCSARKLAFWDLEWEGAETFTCRMSRGDHRVLSRAAEKLDCTIEIVRREGAPYTLAKLRHRQALAVGIAACGTAVLIGSFFVWDIQIAGNETVPREVILRSLEKNGVHRGCFGFALNGEDIRNHVLLEIPELSWVAVLPGQRGGTGTADGPGAVGPENSVQFSGPAGRTGDERTGTGGRPSGAEGNVGDGGAAFDLRRGGHRDLRHPVHSGTWVRGRADVVHPDGQRAPHRGRKTVYRTGKAAPFRDFRQPPDKILCKQ